MRTGSFQPIATSLIRRIFLWATLCALGIGGIQAVVSYLHVQAEFEQEVSAVAESNVPLLSVGIWDIEPDAVQRQVNAIAGRSSIGFVRLSVLTGQTFVAGDPLIAQGKTPRHFDIPQPGRQSASLGYIEIYENPGAFVNELVYSVLSMLFGYGVLTVLICALIVLILRRDLEGPMRHIADFVTRLHPETLTTPLSIERPPGHRRDEIDLVVNGFHVLQQEIDGHIRNLDQLVMQRTSELEAALESIRRLSSIDPLTGCFNRRWFNEAIVQEIERAERYGRPLSVVFADIDHFKQINDTHGHLTGDQVLKAVAECIRLSVRENIDWVVRFGGEEFVIVLPETVEASAIVGAERLRGEIASLVPVGDLPSLSVTASFGVAQLRPGETAQSLIHRADELLYGAKQAGRNRILPQPALPG